MEKINEKEKQFRSGDSGPKYLFRGPRFEWGILLLKRGENLGAHYHQEVEETFYFEKGEGEIVVNGSPQKAKEGDIFRLEPKEKHDILNTTEEAIRIIFIKCPYIEGDKVKA